MADDVTPKSDGPDKDSELTTAKNEVEGTPTAAESVPSDPPASGPADGGLAARPDGPAKKTNIKIGSKREGIKAQPQTLTPGHDVLQVSSKLDISEQTQEQKNYPPPRLDSKITPEVQREIDAALGDMSLDQLMESTVAGEELNEGDKTSGRVHSVRSDDIFVDLGRRNQGVVSVKYFSEVPEVGSMIDVVVNRFDVAEGIYELVVPDAAVDISDWSELSQGMVVEATVTGHNKGGLEVAVNKLKGFIPISQVTLYRVEELEEFVGQKFSCVVTEVNPDRRNLVLSRRAVLEREKAESKQKLIKELKIGEVREGIVTRIQPFGAFVDLGGIDGLLHISQLSWDRIKHPSEVVEEGQKIKVKIAKIATDTGKIGLAYRDTFENPWATVQDRYQSKLRVTGTVTRLMDFGAFVRLEAGIEGLIHVSELAHRRVFRASDVLSEGQEVDVMVLSVDPEAQRISLSLKALEARPEPAKGTGKSEADTDTPVPSPPLPKRKQSGDLKGGTNRPSGGDQFGLKW